MKLIGRRKGPSTGSFICTLTFLGLVVELGVAEEVVSTNAKD
jgi:hypothetical protein